MASRTVYLDNNATSPLDPSVSEAVLRFMAPAINPTCGNPSAAHYYGREAKAALILARQQVADFIGAASPEIILTSGATESINHIIKGAVFGYHKRHRKAHGGAPPPALPHLIVTSVEHYAVMEATRFCVDMGLATATFVPVSRDGVVAAADVAAALQPTTILVSVMVGNNETGALQPVAEVCALVKAARPDVLVHSDASQALGKVPICVGAEGSSASHPSIGTLWLPALDFLTIAGHKLYAPKGVGATFARAGTTAVAAGALPGSILEPLMHGATQERGRRAGTENVALVAGLGAACAAATKKAATEAWKLGAKRARLIGGLFAGAAAAGIPAPVIHGPAARQWEVAAFPPSPAAEVVSGGAGEGWTALPNTAYVAFPGAYAVPLVAELADQVAVSAGAACHSVCGKVNEDPSGAKPSQTLAAMGVPVHLAACTLRLTIGHFNTLEEMDVAAERIIKAVVSVRARTAAALEAMEKAASAPAAPAPTVLTTKHYLADTYRFSCTGALLAAFTLDASGPSPAWVPVPGVAAAGVDAAAISPPVTAANKACAVALVLNETVAHPQGGGQPSDKGLITLHAPCGRAAAAFAFTAVGPTSAGGGTAHFGDFVPLPEGAATPEGAAAAADAVTDASAGAAPLPADLSSMRSACVYISRPHRTLAARLHSAGHLLDLAVRRVHASLTAANGGVEPYPALLPTKGYHFADGPYVEYEGAVPAPHRDTLPALLTKECEGLVAPEAAAQTKVVNISAGDATALAAAGIAPASVAHLPPGADVRVVSVGAPDNACPCGGTHVGNAAQIGRVVVTGVKVKKNTTKVTYVVEA